MGGSDQESRKTGEMLTRLVGGERDEKEKKCFMENIVREVCLAGIKGGGLEKDLGHEGK